MKSTRRHFLTSTAALTAGAWMASRFFYRPITNRPELKAHLRSAAREGWRYGESL